MTTRIARIAAALACTAACTVPCTSAWADELNDLPELACARASTALERAQIGCPDGSSAQNVHRTHDLHRTRTDPRMGASPLDRAEDD